MVNQTNFSAQMPIGGSNMSALRQAARENSPEALKVVAQQFEALLMNMMLKSMREATPKSGMFENEQTKLYTSLYDQQISQNFAKRGLGLADALIRQLSPTPNQSASIDKSSDVTTQQSGMTLSMADGIKQQQASTASSLAMLRLDDAALTDFSRRHTGNSNGDLRLALSDELNVMLTQAIRNNQKLLPSEKTAGSAVNVSASNTSKPAHVRAFQDKLSKHAEEASRATGIPAKFMLGQAALESGWGKRVMVASDGSSSHNLFGIKATKGWTGKTVETTTTEYVNGVAYRKKEKFRAYDSYADSFKDYARLLKSNPRYQKVLSNSNDAASFAQGLQRAGYATDPQYAAKLTRIIQKSLSA